MCSSEWAEWASRGKAGRLNGDKGGCNIEELVGAISVDLNPLADELCCCWETPKLNVWAKSAAAVDMVVELLPNGKNMDDVLVNVVIADVKPTDEVALLYRDGLIDWPALAPL